MADLAPDLERPPRIEVDETLVDDIGTLLRDEQRGMVLNLVADLHPADLADLILHLAPDDADALFGWLPEDKAGAVLPELETARRSDLLDEMPASEIVSLLDEIDTDDAADVLADLPDAVAEQVLPQLEDAAEVEALLHFGDETAGGLMETDYVSTRLAATVDHATEELRRCAAEVDPVYVVYVLDEGDRLVGIVDLKTLVLARGGAAISDIMDPEVVTVEPELDQEDVARIMERYDLVALPVVSADGRMLGRITIDDIVDVIRDEAEEDLQRASGIAGDEEITASVWAISKGRLVWLMIGLVGAYGSGLVIRGFEGALEAAAVLAMFIPIVMAMAGNAGIQSSAIAVQGLASGDLWSSDVVRRIGKELAVALLNGIALAAALAVIVLVMGAAGGLGDADTPRLALTSAVSLLVVIVLATVLGATVPLLLDRVGIDPALATGPFITTSNDIIGLAVFFGVASVLYL
ncbi:MAG: magnesium transporter [Bacteroidota bacterium]